MDWKEIKIHTTNEAIEPVSNILNDAGANGVVIEDPTDLTKKKRSKFGEIYALDPHNYPKIGVIIKAYFSNDSDWEEKKQTVQDNITNLTNHQIDIGLNKVTVHDVYEKDWENEWKKYFKPTKVTDQFVIVPSWEKYTKKNSKEKLITIDPGMAFGTGTHPTTVLSLKALEKTIQNRDTVLDVGTGSGILSIASVLLGADHVYAFDLDDVAVKSTLINVQMNDLNEKVTVKQNDLLNNINQKANIIVSNILADILLLLVDDAWDNLKVDGYFITSGIIESKRQMVVDALTKKGFEIVETNRHENWVSLIAQKSNVRR